MIKKIIETRDKVLDGGYVNTVKRIMNLVESERDSMPVYQESEKKMIEDVAKKPHACFICRKRVQGIDSAILIVENIPSGLGKLVVHEACSDKEHYTKDHGVKEYNC